MTLSVTLILLVSGLIHASWNAMVKSSSDRVTMLGVLYGTMGVVAFIALFFVPPLSPDAWIYLLPAGFIHVIYKYGIIKMYEHGDLSFAYPVARGVSPVVVVLLALMFAGESPTLVQCFGVGLVCFGLLGFLGKRTNISLRAFFYAILTGTIIATYTVLDGLGARATSDALSFAAWVFVFDGFGTLAFTYALRGKDFISSAKPMLLRIVPTGAIAGFAYASVIWALGETTMGGVSAVRESSVVFAALIGTLFLNEPMGIKRIVASVIVLGGIVILNLGL